MHLSDNGLESIAGGHPNVLLITCDQLRKDALACYGNPLINTPNIDQLAARGVRFDQMYVASPVCAPSRGSIATGRYPSVHGLSQNGCVLPSHELTLMEILRRAGYQTYGAGKMHFQPQWQFSPDDSESIMAASEGKGAVNPQPLPWEFPYYGFQQGAFTEDNREGPYADYLRERGLDPWADAHSFTYPQHATMRSAYPPEHHQTAWVADRSIEYLENHEIQRGPFFMWTSFVHPHHPFIPAAPYDSMYDPADMPLPVWDSSEVEQWPEAYREKFFAEEGSHEAIGMHKLSNSHWQKLRAYYYGMVSHIDREVGRLLNALAERDMLDNTIIAFTSDHGEMLGDHHLVFKGTHYDCVTNVPFILTSYRADCAGQERVGLAQSVDVMPTILAAVGVEIPDGVQGHSLMPMLSYPELEGYPEVFIEDVTEARTVRTKQARLTWHGPGNHGELYDLLSDPECLNNLWNSPQAETLQRQLIEILMSRLASNVDPLPSRVAIC